MAEFQIDTLIRRDERMVPMAQAMEPLSEPASRSIAGAITLKIDGREILGVELWDDVDSLWGYLLNGLSRAAQGEPFTCSFPDQPLPIVIEPVGGGRVQLEIGKPEESCHRRVIEDAKAFNAAMAEGGTAFFRWLETVSPQRFSGTWAHIAYLKGEGPPTETWTLEKV